MMAHPQNLIPWQSFPILFPDMEVGNCSEKAKIRKKIRCKGQTYFAYHENKDSV